MPASSYYFDASRRPSRYLGLLLAAHLKGQICNACQRRSVRRLSRGHIIIIIGLIIIIIIIILIIIIRFIKRLWPWLQRRWKLSKIDTQLILNTVRKLASLILLLHSDFISSPDAPPLPGGICVVSNINTAFCLTLVSDGSCCQHSATVVTPQVGLLTTVVSRVRPS